MALDFLPDQPPEPPSIAQTQAALLSLPDGFGAMGACLLQRGLRSDGLLCVADALDAGAAERSQTLGAWDAEVRAMRALATILRDVAPRYAHPARPPLTAEEAEASIRRRAGAAGLSTAGGAS